jgi:hypothetical protein
MALTSIGSKLATYPRYLRDENSTLIFADTLVPMIAAEKVMTRRTLSPSCAT